MATIGHDPAKPTAVFVPGAKYGSSKCWPARHFAQLAEMMLDERPWNVIVVCGPGEEEIGRQIEELTPSGVVSLWKEPLGLGRLKALVAESDLMVTNDTGPRHFAAAFDVPVVTLFGATPQDLTRTCHVKEIALQRTDLDCVPCRQRTCPGEHECMVGLLPEEAFSAVTRLMERYPPAVPPQDGR
jgi:heptosyltransferase-2